MVVLLFSYAAVSDVSSSAAQPASQEKKVDLQQTFHTHSAWQLIVTEGPPTKDYGDNDAPGALTLCLRKGPTGTCVSDSVTPPLRATSAENSIAWEPHYLLETKFVFPRGHQDPPFLLIVTGSLNSGDGDQIVSTQLVTYDAQKDAFRRIYQRSVGRNNNQEVRFITEGPLRGSVISAEPQHHLPYGFWIVVNQLNPAGEYRQVLRYGSATRYNDGNPLAVIDSEMPAIERRLGLWKPGDPIPVPTPSKGRACAKPVLRHDELWCN